MASALLTELGGADGVAATVDDLYRRLLADPGLAPYFWTVDLRRIRAHMAEFLIAALDGPDQYAGRDLGVAHGGLAITDAAFDATLSHLLDALEDRLVRPAVLDSVVERLAPFRALVVEDGGAQE